MASFLSILLTLAVVVAAASGLTIPEPVKGLPKEHGDFCHEHECPGYESLKDLGNGVELRRYQPAKWVVTDVDESSYEKATIIGFNRLFKYISGDNELERKIDMTSPVVTTVRLDADDDFRDDFSVSFFLPYEFQPKDDKGAQEEGGPDAERRRHDCTPAPAPRDDRVHIVSLGEVDAYVLTFDSYAVGFRIKRLALDFFNYLERNGHKDFDRTMFQVAVYDPPYKFIDRHNEIWALRSSGKPKNQRPQ